MNNDEFDTQMRAMEYFHSLRLLPGTWTVIRVDGRCFSHLTEKHFEKPIDLNFQNYMRQAAQALLQELHGIYAYTESDEISILFPPQWEAFDREVEKLVSISASIAAATFTLASQKIAHFDSRIWVGLKPEQVADYFRWRQTDAERCALNGWCYWTLRKEGKQPGEAMNLMRNQSVGAKREMLEQRGIQYVELPAWQRLGTGLYWEEYTKTGYNPVQQQEVTALRRRVKIDEALPEKEAYGDFIQVLCQKYLDREE